MRRTLSCNIKYRTTVCLAFILLSITSITTNANQQNDAADILPSVDLTLRQLMLLEIKSASRRTEFTNDAPAKVTVITKHQIEERGYINLFDLLRGEAGIDTHHYSHETTYNRVAIRGVVGNNKFLIKQDGIIIGSAAGEPLPIADNLPLFNTQQVEIIYGPGSALYGADAFSGIINIVTKNTKSDGTQIGTHLGQNKYQYIYGTSIHQINESVRLNFSGHIHESNNPDLSKTHPDIYTFNDLKDFGGNTLIAANQRKGYFGETNSHSLSLRVALGDDFTFGYRQSLFKSPTSTGLDPDFVDYDSNSSWSSFTGTLFSEYEAELDSTTRTRLVFNHSHYRVDEASKFNNIFSNYTDGYKYARSDKSKLDGQLDFELDEDNKLITGFVVEIVNALPKTADLTVPYNPDLTSAEQTLYYAGTSDTLPIKIYETNYTNLGLFAQHTKSWEHHITSILGIRYDDNSRYGHSVNPRLGLVHKPNQRLTSKLLYGNAFLAPSPEFTYEHFGAFNGTTDTSGDYISNFFFIPNTELKPEEVETVEANFSYLYHNNLLLEASIYHTEVKNLILNASTPSPVTDFIDGGAIIATSFNDNIGNLNIHGIELSFAHTQSFNDSTLKTWGNYTYTDGSMQDLNRSLDVDLPFVAKNKVKLGATYRFRHKYYVTPLLYWIDDSSTDVPDIGSTATSSKISRAYTRIDINAGISDITPGLDMSLKINNLMNRKYYNAGSGVTATLSETPQDPQQITLNINYKF